MVEPNQKNIYFTSNTKNTLNDSETKFSKLLTPSAVVITTITRLCVCSYLSQSRLPGRAEMNLFIFIGWQNIFMIIGERFCNMLFICCSTLSFWLKSFTLKERAKWKKPWRSPSRSSMRCVPLNSPLAFNITCICPRWRLNAPLSMCVFRLQR